MTSVGLRDHDRLDGASNYIIWKARMSFLLNEYGLKAYIDVVVVVHQNANQHKEYKKEMSQVKQLILDGVWDHIVSHIASKDTSKRRWDALATLYQGTSEQRKMYLEEKRRLVWMQKGEGINPYFTKI